MEEHKEKLSEIKKKNEKIKLRESRSLENNEKTKHNDSLCLKKNEKNTIYISEPGLYSLIMKSKLPEAEKFQDWVYEDVLPGLRKMGTYTLEQSDDVRFDVDDDIEFFEEACKMIEDLKADHNSSRVLINYIEREYSNGRCNDAKLKLQAIKSRQNKIDNLNINVDLKNKLRNKMYNEFKVKDEKPKEDAYLDWIQPYE